jgi:hypothetical protein
MAQSRNDDPPCRRDGESVRDVDARSTRLATIRCETTRDLAGERSQCDRDHDEQHNPLLRRTDCWGPRSAHA